jgi:hypothetical protein
VDENNTVMQPVAGFHISSVEKSWYSTAYDTGNGIMSPAKQSISLY